MKRISSIIILLSFFVCYGYSQINLDSLNIRKYFDSLSIELNKPIIPSGFKTYYDCDSVAFFRKDISDTIIFLTIAGYTSITYHSEYPFNLFKILANKYHSYPPSYPTNFLEDGSVVFVQYSEKVFVAKNDTLYFKDINDDDSYKPKMEIGRKYLMGEIDSITMANMTDSVNLKHPAIIKYIPIFSNSMFSTDSIYRYKQILDSSYQKLTLEKKWIMNNKNCFTILIEGDYKGTETAVRYSFNEDFKFIFWEQCNK